MRCWFRCWALLPAPKTNSNRAKSNCCPSGTRPNPTSNGYILNELAKQYAETVEGFELDYEYVDITEIDQKVTTLMASNDLPELCIYESGVRLKNVIESGQILDLDAALTELGVRDYVDSGAASLLIGLVDGVGLYDLPLGLNVEGFWYNKAVFEAAGLDPNSPPKTWDEFLAACEAIKATGIAPIAQGGADQWPMTRVLNAYLVRSVGMDAVKNAMDGTTKWTDRQLCCRRADVPGSGHQGLFRGRHEHDRLHHRRRNGDERPGRHAVQRQLGYLEPARRKPTPRARMASASSTCRWSTTPTTLDDYSMNCGNIMMVSARSTTRRVGDFLKYLVTHIGDYAMTNQKSFKGYKIDNMPADLPVYTQIVGNALSTAKGAFLWFEAKMDSETSTIAQNNIALLYTGEMTAMEYMQALQDSTDKNMK